MKQFVILISLLALTNISFANWSNDYIDEEDSDELSEIPGALFVRIIAKQVEKQVVKHLAPYKKNKRKSTYDKHTKIRPGAPEKKDKYENWKNHSNKKH